MPSIKLGGASGGDPLFLSGQVNVFYSGRGAFPTAGLQLVWDRVASGSLYVTLSAGTTVASGGINVSGGMLDGIQVIPGGSYFVPKNALPPFYLSGVGNCGPYFGFDAAASGQGSRVSFEFL